MEQPKLEMNMSNLACITCRRQKRKCTREIPSCALCLANRRPCNYPADSAAVLPLPATEHVAKLHLDSEKPRNSFPPLFFLDSEIFTLFKSSVDVSDPNLPEALRELATFDDAYLLHLSENYFQSTHRILPFAILLGYHEISSAIYPAAFLTVGHCARLGQAMGIHDRRNAPQMFKSSVSWVEVEEMRRTWWAVFILDRFVNIALENRPFACSEVKPEELLPAEDGTWDKGEQTVTSSLAVTADASLGASTFARTCQAADLLSRVLSHINNNPTTEDRTAYYRQGLQLHSIVSSFHTFLLEEALANNSVDLSCRVSALGICSSAIVTLYYTHSCADLDDVSGQGISEQLSMQKAALDGLHKLAPSTSLFASKLTNLLQSNTPGVLADPFVAQSLYATAKLCLWSANESSNPEYLLFVNTLKNALQVIAPHFQVASEYLSILDKDVAKLGQ
ncbi:hypothetical protein NLG97_g9214 [Lecanicillium saksenae]|uniref:Uncharacterized protein n=1 Tax=Lecanicillium saksenae TaxID=468837 RepID=A0ACC1QGV0_9HYPO|nr:hypothetical protein NLG97_g9214 [Lecanicillium saksenae]